MDAHLDPHDAPEAPQAFKTHPELLAGMGRAEKRSHKAKIAALATESTASLCARMETATDPAMLWPIHQEFNRRYVPETATDPAILPLPPILRGPRHRHGLQGDFIDFAADLQWLGGPFGGCNPRYRLAQAIMKAETGGDTWWELVKKLYTAKTNQEARGAAIALNLDTDQRRHLRTIQTTTTRRQFFDLHGDRFGQLLDELRSEAADKPDKAPAGKRRTPSDIASRRARLFRTHVLLGGTIRDTARYWWALTRERPSLATIHKSVDLAETTFKRLRAGWSKEKKAEDVPPEKTVLTN